MTSPTPRLVTALTKETARVIACGLLADGLDVSKLTPLGRQEIKDALDALLAMVKRDKQ